MKLKLFLCMLIATFFISVSSFAQDDHHWHHRHWHRYGYYHHDHGYYHDGYGDHHDGDRDHRHYHDHDAGAKVVVHF